DGGFSQRPIDDVTLCVTAAELVRDEARGMQSLRTSSVLAAPERAKAVDHGEGHLARPAAHIGVLARGALERAHDTRDLVLTPTAELGHDRVPVVEGIEAAVDLLIPALGQLRPPIPDVPTRQMKTPQERRRVDEVEGDRAARASNRTVVQTQDLVHLLEV